jgi:hypothetical protein
MKRNNINWIFNSHSTERFYNRTALNTTKKQIANSITNNQLVPFKRINTTRSMIYIHVNKEVIKTVMHRKKRKIITILPWKSIFHYNIKLEIHDGHSNRIFSVDLYPDCFLETKKPNALTEIHKQDLGYSYDYYSQPSYEKIKHDHPLFKKVFIKAWEYFEATDEDHLLIQKERSHGCETFETKGKAKKIKTIIKCGTYCEEPI